MKYLFNEGWRFLRTPVGTKREQVMERREEFAEVDIPHDWLIYDAQRLYEDGTGWYWKRFCFREPLEKRAFLMFEGVYMDSAVYVNGHLAGEWKYGYSSFAFEITEYLRQGENDILVSVCFQSPNSRWYSGAGIYRNVYFRVTEAACLAAEGIYVGTEKRGKDFLLKVAGGIDDGRKEAADRQTELTLRHRLYEKNSEGKRGKEIPLLPAPETQTFLVKSPKLWDVDAPFLYELHTQLYEGERLLEEEITSVGFRTTEFCPDSGFWLNGRRLKLNGVCEHHDLGALGAAFNRSAMRRKFRILKEMGVNAVRGAHNMMAPEAVELADEMGLLLISEAFDMWEQSKNPYDYARFFHDWWKKDVERWVCRDRNHPSVILWSIGNEIYDTHAGIRGQELTRMLMEEVKKYDPWGNAAVTIGSNYMPWENAQKCADILKTAGYNYAEKYYQEHHRQHPDWVIYGSETSSIVQSRGVYHFPLKAGILAEDDRQCSALGNSPASWGARSMEDCVTVDRDTEFSMGQFIWSGFDYIGEPTPYHTKNSYFGQIDTAGFPKDSYYVWQSAWTDYRKNPMVHVFPYWDFNEGQQIDVRVCSNCPVVELFLNGKSLGRKKLCHAPGSGRQIIGDYSVCYEKGVLEAVGLDEEGRELVRQRRHSFGDSSRLVLMPENRQVPADGRELLFVQIGTQDREGNPVENACDRIQVEVTGAGRLVGLDNGDSTDYDSYKGTSRRLFNGRLLAIIQAGLAPGKISVRVRAVGLAEAALTLYATAPDSPVARAYGEQGGPALTAGEQCLPRPIVLGKAEEIPVRKVALWAEGERVFTPDRREIQAHALVLPENAEDKEVMFKAVDDAGVPSHLVRLKQEGSSVMMYALGDGAFRLRCMSKSGTRDIRLISQLEFQIKGLGQAYLDPYGFIAGSQYTSVKGEAGNGNERGVATARDGETVVTYSGLDFGPTGSDEITVPVFALTQEEYPIQIWRGIPGEENSRLMAEEIYQKPPIWNVYQPQTFHLKEPFKGIETLSFLLRQKVHIKGFSFTPKAWLTLRAGQADAVYGDSFEIRGQRVEEIGNNVSLQFKDMDFGEEGAVSLTVMGRGARDNTIHVRFDREGEERKEIVEFPRCTDWEEHSFSLEKVTSRWNVTFVFLPGSSFDFDWFRFGK